VQVQEQFLRGRLVYSLSGGARVQLGEELNELTVGLTGLEQVLAGAPVQIGVEVIRRETGEHLPQVWMGGHPSECVALEPLACLEQFRRDLRRRAPTAPPRNEACLRLTRQVEAVGDEPQRLLAFRGVLEPRQDLARVNESLLAVGCALELEPDAVEDVALGL